ncbi:GNAT family N-acetyltransferase [Motiliproteus sp. SC1-56]|uniref:GNAT family N-acetyltransferase n=1 Tax=Motiliproteus sp. SC1-56 TaxID=2799565 RepID=UPI001A8C67DB|nr:N-acetyltransferase [Motiliproteus sp. SC1-56]
MQATIRDERPGDIEPIENVTVQAFLNAPHTDHREQHIVRALREAGALSVSLVAETRGEVVAHVAASPVTLSDGATGWYGIGPVSVMPAHQRTGLGSQLMEAALQRLQHLGAAGAVVLGDPAYYSRFGFKPEPELVLPGVPAPYFQALAWGDSLPRGEVAYHPAFNATG